MQATVTQPLSDLPAFSTTQEKRLISKFFDEISQDSGKHTSGVKVIR